jgi:hypothetical protein
VLEFSAVYIPQPINAISHIVLCDGDLGSAWDGPPIPMVLTRQTVKPAEMTRKECYSMDDGIRRTEIPPAPSPPANWLPKAGRVALHIKFRQCISGPKEGHTGQIFDIEGTVPHGDGQQYKIPSMVAKLAHPGKSKHLAHEASFYEEMRCLQGSVVPRCYGLFELRSVFMNSKGCNHGS